MTLRARCERRRIRPWTPAVLLVFATTPVAGQSEIFERGNQLYQAEDYAGAIDAYESVLSAGYESAPLYYNLGNAYFKSGDLGRSILNWERALVLDPGHQDAAANLTLARTLTVDEIEPLPEFWLVSIFSWWVHALPRPALVALATLGWVLLAGATSAGVLLRDPGARRIARWGVAAGSAAVLVLGGTLTIRELGIGSGERAVVIVEAVQVRSAPDEDDDLVLFEIHEGTVVRVDRRTDRWIEVVLADGKVGWVAADATETI